MLFNRINNFLKNSLRTVLMVMVCGLLFISAVSPAQATPSKTTDGEASLNRIQKETDDVARSAPRGLEEVTKKAQAGLNAVQGGADADKMVTPDETNAKSVRDKAADLLKDATD